MDKDLSSKPLMGSLPHSDSVTLPKTLPCSRV